MYGDLEARVNFVLELLLNKSQETGKKKIITGDRAANKHGDDTKKWHCHRHKKPMCYGVSPRSSTKMITAINGRSGAHCIPHTL